MTSAIAEANPTEHRRSSRLATALLVVPMLVAYALLPFRAVTDPDYWWHVRTGQLIHETRSVPKADPFSYTASGRPWVTHEWLTELAMYLVQRQFGYPGNAVLFGVIIALTWLAVYRTCRLRGLGETGALEFTLWAGAMSLGSLDARPQMITAFFLAVFALILALFRRGRRHLIWLLPPLMALWVNLHGGYVIGLGLIVLALAGELWSRRAAHNRQLPRDLIQCLLLSILVVPLNPHGLKELAYPFSYAGSGNASMRMIVEWQSPNFHEPLLLVFCASLLLAVAVGVWGGSASAGDLLIGLAFTALALRSVRNIPLYAIVVTPILGERLGLWVRAVRRPFSAWRHRKLLLFTWPPVVLLLIIVMAVRGGGHLQLAREPSSEGYPAAAVDYLRAHPEDGRLFNDYGWGGYLIYELYPTRRVFIDGRADMYGDAFMETYLKAANVSPGWRETLDHYQVRFVLVPKDGPLAGALEGEPGWHLACEGAVERLFVRGAEE